MILATAVFTVMIALVKICRETMSGIELVFWRGAVSVPLVLITMRGTGFRIRSRGPLVLRIVFGIAAMTCFYTAARGLALVDLNLITRLQPILIAIAAPLFLGPEERPGPRVWIAAAIGFAGCAIILTPGLRVGSLFGLLALVATMSSSAAHLSLRRVAVGDHGRTIVFWFHACMTVFAFCAVFAVHGELRVPEVRLVPAVLGIGVAATAGQLLITKAYSVGKAPVVAAASYAGVLWSLVADLVVFRALPGVAAVIGGLLVLISSLALVVRSWGETRRLPVRGGGPSG
jgi:drug/metabolite transporter (DMT)-like permease